MPTLRDRFRAVLAHLRGIVRTQETHYINERGETVYGKPPRSWPENPIKALSRPTLMNYVYFFIGWMAWTVDGYDFHTISLSVSNLAKYYGKGREEISTAITLTLLFRSVGAVIFGLTGDLYGRKWPMIINLIIIGGMQLATAWCNKFSEFLTVRALFGIAMGGIWGLASSMGLENMPVESRGLFSGILQQGYALGYLIAAGINMGLVPKSKHSFKLLFYIGAGITFAVAIARLPFPESKQFEERKAHEKELEAQHHENCPREPHHHEPISVHMHRIVDHEEQAVKMFTKDARKIFRVYWRRCLYCIGMLALFNWSSHTSQDMYPTYMHETKLFSQPQASKATMIAKVGAIIGGTLFGYYSQILGRRFAIIIASVLGACLIPLWVLPTSWGNLTAGAFLIQFMVQGAWGVVPIHLQELSPPQFRSSFPGICYQLGNMLAAPAAQVTSAVSEGRKKWVKGKDGVMVQSPDYAFTQAVMMSVIFCVLAIWVGAGKEKLGSRFEMARAAGDVGGEENGEEGAEKVGARNLEEGRVNEGADGRRKENEMV